MKKNLTKKINIISILLLLLVFFTNIFLSYNSHIKAQDEFMKNSLSFLLSIEDNEDYIRDLKSFSKKNEDIDLSYRDEKGQVLFESENFNKDLIKDIKEKDKNLDRKINLMDDSYFFYSSKGKNTLFLQKKDPSFFDYNIKNIRYTVFILMISVLFNIFALNKIRESSMKNLEKNNFPQEKLKRGYEREKNHLGKSDINIYKENELLRSRIFSINEMADNMEEGLIYFNNDGFIVVINEAAKRMLNIDKSATLDGLIDQEEYRLALRETRLLSRGKNIDLRVGQKDIKLFIDPIFENMGLSYLILAIDYSESKKAEKMRREFTANVSHELKSPLTSINGYAELIASGLAKKEDVKNFAEIIYKEGNRLLKIIDDILKLSKLDEKSFEERKKSVNVREIAENCIQRFMTLADQKNLVVENRIKDYNINTNLSLFEDLITNIYENAIKYNKYGGKIILDSKLEEDKYYIYISDTGIGMSKKDMGRIFERFYLADKSRARNMKSTGLGLSIVKHICDYLDYDIEVDSELGQGSKFTIEIDI